MKFGRGLVLSKKRTVSTCQRLWVEKWGHLLLWKKSNFHLLSILVIYGPGHSFSMAASRFSRDVWLRSCIGTLRVRVCPLSRGGCLPHGRALAELVWTPVSGEEKMVILILIVNFWCLMWYGWTSFCACPCRAH